MKLVKVVRHEHNMEERSMEGHHEMENMLNFNCIYVHDLQY